MHLRRVEAALQRFTFLFSSEAELHSGIASVLRREAIAFEHEHVAGPKDRFDFLIEPGIVVEAKIKGSLPEALRQCARYAAREDVNAVILVSTRHWGRVAVEIPPIHGKPVRVVHLRGASF